MMEAVFKEVRYKLNEEHARKAIHELLVQVLPSCTSLAELKVVEKQVYDIVAYEYGKANGLKD